MKVMTWNYRAILCGLLLMLPLVIAHFIMAFPMMSSSPIFPVALLLFLPVSALAFVYPMLFREKDGSRKIYILNSILAVLLVALFFFLFIPLAKDIYKCQILEIPNCD